MRQDQRVRYCEDGEVKSFEFPFIDRYYSYIVILPQRKHGVREIESKLSFGRFKYLLANQRDRNIEVRLAETKVSSSYDFGGRLAMLGLSSLADTRPRQINKFDLYGGEQLRASSNTWRVLRLWSPVPTEDPFNVDRSFKPDHPFIYFVVDNRSGAIMFMGRYSGE